MPHGASGSLQLTALFLVFIAGRPTPCTPFCLLSEERPESSPHPQHPAAPALPWGTDHTGPAALCPTPHPATTPARAAVCSCSTHSPGAWTCAPCCPAPPAAQPARTAPPGLGSGPPPAGAGPARCLGLPWVPATLPHLGGVPHLPRRPCAALALALHFRTTVVTRQERGHCECTASPRIRPLLSSSRPGSQ